MKLKFYTFLLVPLIIFTGCVQKQGNKTATKEKNYNPTLYKILEAHGGIKKWNQERTFSFQTGNQTQTIDLKTRNVKIETPNFSMGKDGNKTWLKQDSTYFKGSPRFYSSLMFYFHAMPFVFADDGINYEKVPDKALKGKTYKGLKMTFGQHVGYSPKDEYILYYDPKTYKMAWLAYIVTYFSHERSDSFHLIHYKTWQKTDGLLLPTELQWYQYQDGKVGEPGNNKTFVNTSLSKEKKGNDFYAVPAGAVVDSTGTK